MRARFQAVPIDGPRGRLVMRFKFPYINREETLQLGFVDREEKVIHKGHLCCEISSIGNITLVNHKTALVNFQPRTWRQACLDRKEPLPVDLNAPKGETENRSMVARLQTA